MTTNKMVKLRNHLVYFQKLTQFVIYSEPHQALLLIYLNHFLYKYKLQVQFTILACTYTKIPSIPSF